MEFGLNGMRMVKKNQRAMRVKCATLAWHTFMHAAEGKKEIANTEKTNQ